MKTVLEFNMPEDTNDLKMAQQGPAYHAVLWNLDQIMRAYLKHGHHFESVDAAIESIRNELYNQMREHYCSFTE